MLGKSKLRLMAVLVGAIAAFSVVGFAASFQVNEGQSTVNAEGETLVVSCDTGLIVWKADKWVNPVEGGPGAGGFFVKWIQIRGIDAACAGKYFTIVVTGANGQMIATSNWVQYTSGNITWTPAQNIAVADIHDIHVAIAGNPQDPIAP